MVQDIDPQNIDKEIERLTSWEKKKEPDSIQKSFKFNTFIEAFQFMTSCAAYAEKIGHHPDWRNVYNKLDVTLTTHDINSLSNLDVLMAKYMDELEISMRENIHK